MCVGICNCMSRLTAFGGVPSFFRWYPIPYSMSMCCKKMGAWVVPWKTAGYDAPLLQTDTLLQDQCMGPTRPQVVVGQVLAPDGAQALRGIDTKPPAQVYIECICISWSYVYCVQVLMCLICLERLRKTLKVKIVMTPI